MAILQRPNSSKWNHRICDPCWEERCRQRGEFDRQPMRILDLASNQCCFCGLDTASGILVREDPAKVPCGGMAGEHEADQ